MYLKAFCIAFLICIFSQVNCTEKIEQCMTIADYISLEKSLLGNNSTTIDTGVSLIIRIEDTDESASQGIVALKEKEKTFLLISSCYYGATVTETLSWDKLKEKKDIVKKNLQSSFKIDFNVTNNNCVLFKTINEMATKAFEANKKNKPVNAVTIPIKIAGLDINETQVIKKLKGGEFVRAVGCAKNAEILGNIFYEEKQDVEKIIEDHVKGLQGAHQVTFSSDACKPIATIQKDIFEVLKKRHLDKKDKLESLTMPAIEDAIKSKALRKMNKTWVEASTCEVFTELTAWTDAKLIEKIDKITTDLEKVIDDAIKK